MGVACDNYYYIKLSKLEMFRLLKMKPHEHRNSTALLNIKVIM